MNVFELTRALVDIDSVTPNEEQVGVFLSGYLAALASRTGGQVERIEVEPHRFNVLASWDAPVVTFSTHIDTVPPFFASREDDEFIWGRGACDTKGIIASMILAVEALLAEGERRYAQLHEASPGDVEILMRLGAIRSRRHVSIFVSASSRFVVASSRYCVARRRSMR